MHQRLSHKVLKGQYYDYFADIWSFGCIAFECLAGVALSTRKEGDTVR